MRLSSVSFYDWRSFTAFLAFCFLFSLSPEIIEAQQQTSQYQPAYQETNSSNSVLVESTFDSDSEGWSLTGDGEQLTHESSGGRPGGYIHATDQTSGELWFFKAPSKFYGDRSAAYGGVLNFEQKLLTTGSSVSSNEYIHLEGAGMELIYKMSVIPDTQWTAFRVPLREQAGWEKGTGGQPTSTEFQQVLADLQSLEIRGEHISGGDQEAMDNVQLRSDRAIEIHVNPRSTYLHVASEDDALDANPINLEALNLTSFNELTVNLTGDYDAGPRIENDMIGVLSSSSTLEDKSQTHRLPDAIDAGEDIETVSTYYGNEKTDISEDFPIYSTLIERPTNASFLFVSPWDNNFQDNSDPDNNYAVRLSPAENISNYALDFDGSSNVEVPHSAELNPSSITVEAWVKARSYPSYATVLMKTSGGGWTDGYGLANYSGSDMNFYINQWDNNYARDTVETNQWTHIAATYDGNVIRIYKNGELEDTTHYSQQIDHSQNVLHIGMGHGGYHWNGIIEEVRVWDYARSSSEIASAYKTTLSGDEPGLVAYYPMDGGSGSTLQDVSGNGNAGTINGATWTYSAAPIGGATFLVSDEGAYARDSLSFSWTRFADANAYQLQISTLPDASGIIDRVDLEDTTSYKYATDGLTEGQKYYARVAASTDGGSTYEKYTTFTDGVTVDRTAPSVEAPAGRISETGTELTFYLSANDNGSVNTYHVQIDDETSFNNPVKEVEVSADNPQVTYQGSRGTTYYARAYAIDEAGNKSNYSPVSSGVSVSQLADLKVTDIQIPNEVVSGSKIQPEWTVENTGLHSTRSSGWEDAVYLSRDTTLDNDDLKIQTVGNASSLSQDASYRQSPDFTIPLRVNVQNKQVAVQGEYYVLVKTDKENREHEQSETNNTTYSAGKLTANLPPLPDVKVTRMLDPIPYCRQFIPCPTVRSFKRTLNDSSRKSNNVQKVGGSCLAYVPCGPVEYVGQTRRMLLSPKMENFQSPPRGYKYRFIVKNQGQNSTDKQFRNMVYYQEGSSETLDLENAVTMGEVFATGSIAPGEKDTVVSSILPRRYAAINEGHLWVDLNYRDDIFEGTGASNNLFRDSVTTQFRIVPPSDLEGISLNAPSSAVSGDSIKIDWEIRNNGPSAVEPSVWYDQAFISQSQTLNKEQATRIGQFPKESEDGNAISSNSTYTATDTVKLPEGIEGTYYLHLQADGTDLINENVPQEQDYENNNTTSTSIEMSLADYPDLQVANIKVPDKATAGSSFLLSYTVQNDGSGTVSSNAEWQDVVVLRQEKQLSTITVDEPLAVYNQSRTVNSNGSYQVNKTIQLPSDLEEGSYYIYIKTDQNADVYEHGSDAENNLTQSAAIEIKPEPRADLSVTLDRIGSQSPKSGKPLAVHWTVNNTGPKTQSSSWYDRIYLSKDRSLNADQDIEIARKLHKGNVGKNGNYTVKDTVVMPNDVTGEYYLLLMVDPNNQNKEYNRSNNLAVTQDPLTIKTGPRPDLTISSINPLGTPISGQPLDVEIKVTNEGADLSGEEKWFESWILTLDPTSSEQGTQLISRTISRKLLNGESYKDTVRVTVPPFATDAFFLEAKADSRDDKFEINEDNNSETTQINIEVPPPSDLVVENISVPDSAQPGEEITVPFDIVNQGDNAANGMLYHAVYVSSDQQLDTGDPRLAIKRDVLNKLMPQSSSRQTMTVQMPKLSGEQMQSSNNEVPYDALQSNSSDSLYNDVPGVLPGDYHLLVWTDVRNNIRESKDGNNRSASSDATRLTVPELPLQQEVTTSVKSNQRIYYKLNLSADQDLRIDLSHTGTTHPDRNLGVYVAYERPATTSDYDAAHPAGEEGDARVLLPDTRSGTYYVMIRNPYLASDELSEFTIKAQSFGFNLFSITPGKGGSKGRVVTDVTGARLTRNTEIFLEGENGQKVEGEVVERTSTMKWKVRFDLRSVSQAKYDVVAEQGSDQTRIEKGFEVVPTVSNNMKYALSGPSQLLHGGKATFEISVRNENNIDMDIVTLTVMVPGNRDFNLSTSDFFGPPLGTTPPDTMELPPAGVPHNLSFPNTSQETITGWGSVTAYAKKVRVGEELSAQLTLSNIPEPVGSNTPLIIQVRGFSEKEFLDRTVKKMRQVLKTTTGADPSKVRDDMEGPLQEMYERMQDSDVRRILDDYYTQTGMFGDGSIKGPTLPLRFEADRYPEPSQNKSLASSSIQQNEGGRTCEQIGSVLGFGWEVFAFSYSAGILGLGGITGATGGGIAGVATVLAGLNPVSGAALVLSAAMLYMQYRTASSGGGGPYSSMYCFLVTGSFDPNKIVGPSGYGEANWIQADKRQRYRILFENDPERANAPARTVSITQPLDTALSSRSIELESFGFGSYEFDIPDNQTYYSRTVDVTDSLGVKVRFNAGYDQRNGELYFSFRSIDPQTGEVPNNLDMGFLPPNENAPEGEGFVEYTVRPASKASNGTEIEAQADIVFDRNAPITTNEHVNVLDAEAPSTSIASGSSEVIDTTDVLLRWNGTDTQPGSGVRSYTLYGARKDSSFEIIKRGIRDTSYVFEGTRDTEYKFFVQGSDNVENLESDKRGSATYISVNIGEKGRSTEKPKKFKLHENYPNPFNPTTNITYELPEKSQVTLTVYNVLGRRVRTLVNQVKQPGIHTVQFNAGTLASGIYFYRIRAGEFQQTHKMLYVK